MSHRIVGATLAVGLLGAFPSNSYAVELNSAAITIKQAQM